MERIMYCQRIIHEKHLCGHQDLDPLFFVWLHLDPLFDHKHIKRKK